MSTLNPHAMQDRVDRCADGAVARAGALRGGGAKGLPGTLAALLAAAAIVALGGCGEKREPAPLPAAVAASAVVQAAAPVAAGPVAAVAGNTCSGTYPSYWQEPRFADMWAGQKVSNQPSADWSGPLFKLSDRYPADRQDDAGAQPWRGPKYKRMFDTATSMAERTALAQDYIWDLMRYIQQGNIDSGDVATDWTLCDNKVRNWYHIPFQTYDALSGREFVHGLTREAPVTFSMKDAARGGQSVQLPSTVWAVAFYNPTAAHTLGTVWRPDGRALTPTSGLRFDEGAVIGKLLFSTLSAEQLPFLRNVPAWKANLSDPKFCNCKPASGKQCTMVEESRQCPRSLSTGNDGKVLLMQFDVAVRDSRAPGTGWVFGTFVADGERKAGQANPWNRISPLGLMWGNDTPPPQVLAANHPSQPRSNGFQSAAIFWDTVDMLNASGGETIAQRPGHLGCNSRLNGPADNASSSCMSCHMTASVVDQNLVTPPIMAQFGGITSECVTPDAKNPGLGTDAGGGKATVINGVGFDQMDAIYFDNVAAGAPVNMFTRGPGEPVGVLGKGVPSYADGQTNWVSLDYSLQLSISLVQWAQWQRHSAQQTKERPSARFQARLPAR